MIDLSQICAALREIGVVEVILESENESGIIEFNGFDDSPTGGHFKIRATNVDFAENGL